MREITEECGYRDQHYFSYCFKRATGVSPNQCRKDAGGM
ncbi:MAG: helix-turn-helix domain-containing protein [Lachnospiraceae bacterium]